MRFACSLLLLLVGCPPGLDEFDVTGADGGPGFDGGPGLDGGPGSDGGPDPDGGGGGTCPTPHLLVAVEGLGTDESGRVVRLTLDGRARCADLTGGGGLDPQPMAIVPLGSRLVVAGREDLQVLDPVTDRIVTTVPFASVVNPAAAFPIFHPTERQTLGAVALSAPGSPGINRLMLVAEDGRVVEDWTVGGSASDLAFGSTLESMTADPRERGRMLLLDDMRFAAAEADPFTETVTSSPPWINTRSGVVLRTVAAIDDDGTHRLVWTGRDGTTDGLYYFDESLPRDDEHMQGPIGCTTMDPCDWAHAIPDPTSPYHYFAICEREASIETRRVLRVAQGGACEVVLESTGLGTRPRMSFLAIRD